MDIDLQSIPEKAQETFLRDAARRDRTTARRIQLFNLLRDERFLTREQLITRLEGVLGRGCFGVSAWADTFYRDMGVVKEAFKEAGSSVKYSRSKTQPGYYLQDQPPLDRELLRAIEGSIAEVSPAQAAVYKHLTPADRFWLGCSLSESARQVVAYRIRKRRPELSPQQAIRMAMEQGETYRE